jgi:hypothetical protein
MLAIAGAKHLQPGSAGSSGMHGRSSSQPQLHHDMDGQMVDSNSWGNSSWEAPERRSSASNLDLPAASGSGSNGGGGGAGPAATSRLAHSSGDAFAGFEGMLYAITMKVHPGVASHSQAASF